MIEKTCNLWLEPAQYRCIPTNGALTGEGEAVMDAGLAKEAADRFVGVEGDLGRLIASRGNHVHLVRPDLTSFPVQQYQWGGPSLQTIERSAKELCELVGEAKTLLPRPGCGAGELPWEQVAKALESLPDNIIVVKHV